MALVNTEAIRDAVAFCVGEGITIYWDGEAETPMATVPYVVSPAGACRVRLSLSTAIQVGEDDVRNVHNTSSDLIETTVSGNRLATLSLRIEADAREEAYETAERVRTRLRFRAAHELLKAANISIATIENNQGIDYSWDNRDISACVLDIRLNIGSNDRDSDITYIETVNTNNIVEGSVTPRPKDFVPVLLSLQPVVEGYFFGDKLRLSGEAFFRGSYVQLGPAVINPVWIDNQTLEITLPNLTPDQTYDIKVWSAADKESEPLSLYYAATDIPELDSANYSLWGAEGGGMAIVLAGNKLAAVEEIEIEIQGEGVFSVSPVSTSNASVTFMLPSMPEGEASVRVRSFSGWSEPLTGLECWTPQSIADLLEYYTANGLPDGLLSVWNSSAGITRAFSASGSLRPFVDSNAFGVGLAGLLFSGAQYLTAPFLSHTPTEPRSVFVVASWSSTDNTSAYPNYSVPLPFLGGSGGWGAFGASADAIAITSHSVGGSPSGNILGGAGLNDSKPHLLGFVNSKPDQSAKMYVDGQLVNTAENIGFTSFDLIGSSYPAGTDVFSGKCGMLIHFTNVLTPEQISKLTSWAGQQFGTPI